MNFQQGYGDVKFSFTLLSTPVNSLNPASNILRIFYTYLHELSARDKWLNRGGATVRREGERTQNALVVKFSVSVSSVSLLLLLTWLQQGHRLNASGQVEIIQFISSKNADFGKRATMSFKNSS